EVLVVWHPVEFERRENARGPSVETSGDVLLPVGHEITFGGFRVDRDVDAKAEAGRLRHVLHHLHLGAIITDAVDVKPLGRRHYFAGNPIYQRILAALRAVDEFETLRGLSAGEGA